MGNMERVTVTLPGDLVDEIDRREKNRSRFVAEAVQRELERRRQVELERSLESPHPECGVLAGQGLEEWARGLPAEDTASLVEASAGRNVRWVPGRGWVEEVG